MDDIDRNYRITAHFIDWVILHHKDDLLALAHIAIHQGYSDDLWKKWNGKHPDPDAANYQNHKSR